jgi:hypothetical protein
MMTVMVQGADLGASSAFFALRYILSLLPDPTFFHISPPLTFPRVYETNNALSD